MRLVQHFFRYVFQNIAGMIGVSLYILADTFFIARYAGADGITVLNLSLPVYGLIFAIGAMTGIGSATRYSIRKAGGEQDLEGYFTNAILWDGLLSLPFMAAGILAPELVLRIMGADPQIRELGREYVRIFLMFTPFFMMNYTFTAFVRNDHAPGTAMLGMLAGSLCNIVLDYLLMFRLDLGLTGAAAATAASPVITILICSIHLLGKKHTILTRPIRLFQPFRWQRPSFGLLVSCCQLGIPAFVGEVSSAVTTGVFNMLLLASAGNTGVAAYGVVANLSLVAMAVFNGIAQGVQPLFSTGFGKGDGQEVRRLLYLALSTVVVTELLVVTVVWQQADLLAGIFNSQGDVLLQNHAAEGLRLYFPGYFAAGINMILTSYLAATDKGRLAFSVSLLRGVAAITLCAIVMAGLFGMRGIWLSFPAAELLTMGFLAVRGRRKERNML